MTIELNHTANTLEAIGTAATLVNFNIAATDADAIHDNVAGEIIAVSAKATPVGADVVLIEDTEDSNNKKRATLTSIVALAGGGGGTVQGTHQTYDIKPADEGTVAGNARGENTVDLQTDRSAATMVAAQQWSAILSGRDNTGGGGYSVICGGYSNAMQTSLGGSGYSFLGGGYDNNIFAFAGVNGYNTLCGGRENAAKGVYAFVGGGYSNFVGANFSVICGGNDNLISGAIETYFQQSAIVGGNLNTISTGSAGTYVFIGGGRLNSAYGSRGTIGGGEDNIVSGSYGTVPGGQNNEVTANYGFAAGRNAHCDHQGAIVFGDSQTGDFSSIAVNEFAVRCAGGFRIVDGNQTAGYVLKCDANGTGTWQTAGGGDADAIHDNIADEINQITVKSLPVSGDILIIEDSAASWAKKKVEINTLAGTRQGVDATYDIRAFDEGTAAGNARGENSVDLQTDRGAANQVAAGAYSAILSGHDNRVTSDYAVCVGGNTNQSTFGLAVFMGGGLSNSCNSNYTAIVGGQDNGIGGLNGHHSFIGGGQDNLIVAGFSTGNKWCVITGGYSNSITSQTDYGFMGGGNDNSMAALCNAAVMCGGSQNAMSTSSAAAFLGGGDQNQIFGQAAVLCGGLLNDCYGARAFLGGGDNNLFHNTNANLSVVCGGTANLMNGSRCFIGGGGSNECVQDTFNGTYAAIVGGLSNYTAADYAFVGGGRDNDIYSDAKYSVICGGQNHIIAANGTYNFIGGGFDHQIDGTYGTICGGWTNVIAGSGSAYNFLGGGHDNSIGGSYNVLGGGEDCYISGNNHCFVGGGDTCNAQAAAAVCVGGLNNTSAGNYGGILCGSDNQVHNNGVYGCVTHGTGAQAEHYGERTFSNGKWFERGDRGFLEAVMSRQVTHSTTAWFDLYLNGTDTTYLLKFDAPNNTDQVWTFEAMIVGQNSDNTKKFSYKITGMAAYKLSTTTMSESHQVTTIYEDDTSFNVQAAVDNTNNALLIQVADADGNSDEIRWVCHLKAVKTRW